MNENKQKNSPTSSGSSEFSRYVCGCGREGRYVKIDKNGNKEYACNKYGRCPSYDALREQRDTLANALKICREAMKLTR